MDRLEKNDAADGSSVTSVISETSQEEDSSPNSPVLLTSLSRKHRSMAGEMYSESDPGSPIIPVQFVAMGTTQLSTCHYSPSEADGTETECVLQDTINSLCRRLSNDDENNDGDDDNTDDDNKSLSLRLDITDTCQPLTSDSAEKSQHTNVSLSQYNDNTETCQPLSLDLKSKTQDVESCQSLKHDKSNVYSNLTICSTPAPHSKKSGEEKKISIHHNMEFLVSPNRASQSVRDSQGSVSLFSTQRNTTAVSFDCSISQGSHVSSVPSSRGQSGGDLDIESVLLTDTQHSETGLKLDAPRDDGVNSSQGAIEKMIHGSNSEPRTKVQTDHRVDSVSVHKEGKIDHSADFAHTTIEKIHHDANSLLTTEEKPEHCVDFAHNVTEKIHPNANSSQKTEEKLDRNGDFAQRTDQENMQTVKLQYGHDSLTQDCTQQSNGISHVATIDSTSLNSSPMGNDKEEVISKAIHDPASGQRNLEQQNSVCDAKLTNTNNTKSKEQMNDTSTMSIASDQMSVPHKQTPNNVIICGKANRNSNSSVLGNPNQPTQNSRQKKSAHKFRVPYNTHSLIRDTAHNKPAQNNDKQGNEVQEKNNIKCGPFSDYPVSTACTNRKQNVNGNKDNKELQPQDNINPGVSLRDTIPISPETVNSKGSLEPNSNLDPKTFEHTRSFFNVSKEQTLSETDKTSNHKGFEKQKPDPSNHFISTHNVPGTIKTPPRNHTANNNGYEKGISNIEESSIPAHVSKTQTLMSSDQTPSHNGFEKRVSDSDEHPIPTTKVPRTHQLPGRYLTLNYNGVEEQKFDQNDRSLPTHDAPKAHKLPSLDPPSNHTVLKKQESLIDEKSSKEQHTPSISPSPKPMIQTSKRFKENMAQKTQNTSNKGLTGTSMTSVAGNHADFEQSSGKAGRPLKKTCPQTDPVSECGQDSEGATVETLVKEKAVVSKKMVNDERDASVVQTGNNLTEQDLKHKKKQTLDAQSTRGKVDRALTRMVTMKNAVVNTTQSHTQEMEIVRQLRSLYGEILRMSLSSKHTVTETGEQLIRHLHKQQQTEKAMLAQRVRQGKMTSSDKYVTKQRLQLLTQRCTALQSVVQLHQQLKRAGGSSNETGSPAQAAEEIKTPTQTQPKTYKMEHMPTPISHTAHTTTTPSQQPPPSLPPSSSQPIDKSCRGSKQTGPAHHAIDSSHKTGSLTATKQCCDRESAGDRDGAKTFTFKSDDRTVNGEYLAAMCDENDTSKYVMNNDVRKNDVNCQGTSKRVTGNDVRRELENDVIDQDSNVTKNSTNFQIHEKCENDNIYSSQHQNKFAADNNVINGDQNNRVTINDVNRHHQMMDCDDDDATENSQLSESILMSKPETQPKTKATSNHDTTQSCTQSLKSNITTSNSALKSPCGKPCSAHDSCNGKTENLKQKLVTAAKDKLVQSSLEQLHSRSSSGEETLKEESRNVVESSNKYCESALTSQNDTVSKLTVADQSSVDNHSAVFVENLQSKSQLKDLSVKSMHNNMVHMQQYDSFHRKISNAQSHEITKVPLELESDTPLKSPPSKMALSQRKPGSVSPENSSSNERKISVPQNVENTDKLRKSDTEQVSHSKDAHQTPQTTAECVSLENDSPCASPSRTTCVLPENLSPASSKRKTLDSSNHEDSEKLSELETQPYISPVKNPRCVLTKDKVTCEASKTKILDTNTADSYADYLPETQPDLSPVKQAQRVPPVTLSPDTQDDTGIEHLSDTQPYITPVKQARSPVTLLHDTQDDLGIEHLSDTQPYVSPVSCSSQIKETHSSVVGLFKIENKRSGVSYESKYAESKVKTYNEFDSKGDLCKSKKKPGRHICQDDTPDKDIESDTSCESGRGVRTSKKKRGQRVSQGHIRDSDIESNKSFESANGVSSRKKKRRQCISQDDAPEKDIESDTLCESAASRESTSKKKREKCVSDNTVTASPTSDIHTVASCGSTCDMPTSENNSDRSLSDVVPMSPQHSLSPPCSPISPSSTVLSQPLLQAYPFNNSYIHINNKNNSKTIQNINNSKTNNNFNNKDPTTTITSSDSGQAKKKTKFVKKANRKRASEVPAWQDSDSEVSEEIMSGLPKVKRRKISTSTHNSAWMSTKSNSKAIKTETLEPKGVGVHKKEGIQNVTFSQYKNTTDEKEPEKPGKSNLHKNDGVKQLTSSQDKLTTVKKESGKTKVKPHSDGVLNLNVDKDSRDLETITETQQQGVGLTENSLKQNNVQPGVLPQSSPGGDLKGQCKTKQHASASKTANNSESTRAEKHGAKSQAIKVKNGDTRPPSVQKTVQKTVTLLPVPTQSPICTVKSGDSRSFSAAQKTRTLMPRPTPSPIHARIQISSNLVGQPLPSSLISQSVSGQDPTPSSNNVHFSSLSNQKRILPPVPQSPVTILGNTESTQKICVSKTQVQSVPSSTVILVQPSPLSDKHTVSLLGPKPPDTTPGNKEYTIKKGVPKSPVRPPSSTSILVQSSPMSDKNTVSLFASKPLGNNQSTSKTCIPRSPVRPSATPILVQSSPETISGNKESTLTPKVPKTPVRPTAPVPQAATPAAPVPPPAPSQSVSPCSSMTTLTGVFPLSSQVLLRQMAEDAARKTQTDSRLNLPEMKATDDTSLEGIKPTVGGEQDIKQHDIGIKQTQDGRINVKQHDLGSKQAPSSRQDFKQHELSTKQAQGGRMDLKQHELGTKQALSSRQNFKQLGTSQALSDRINFQQHVSGLNQSLSGQQYLKQHDLSIQQDHVIPVNQERQGTFQTVSEARPDLEKGSMITPDSGARGPGAVTSDTKSVCVAGGLNPGLKQLPPGTKVIVVKKLPQVKTSQTTNAPGPRGSFLRLIRSGVLQSGHLNLSLTLHGKEKRASILSDGRIRDVTGLTFLSPITWYRAVTGLNQAKPNTIYSQIHYRGRTLADISRQHAATTSLQQPPPSTATTTSLPTALPTTTTTPSAQSAPPESECVSNIRAQSGETEQASRDTPQYAANFPTNINSVSTRAHGDTSLSTAALLASWSKVGLVEDSEVTPHTCSAELASFWAQDFAKITLTPTFWDTVEDWS